MKLGNPLQSVSFSFSVFLLVVSHSVANGCGASDETTTPRPLPIDAVCPANCTIAPCICIPSPDGATLECKGPNIDQAVLDNVLKTLRSSVDAVDPGQVLKFYDLRIHETEMTSLDLTFVLHTKFRHLDLYSNLNLTSLVVAGPSTENPAEPGLQNLERSIEVEHLGVWKSAIANEGIGDVLKYFSTSAMTTLGFVTSKVRGQVAEGGSDDQNQEFIPGLFDFPNLTKLSISANYFGGSDFGRGRFRKMTKLERFHLGWNNIAEFYDNAFLFDDGDFTSSRFYVSLEFNRLTDASFQNIESTGLTSARRPISLYLKSNRITVISEGSFKPFLLAHPDNDLQFDDNPITCRGSSMKWLKDNPEAYKHRVLNAYCEDDPGKDVFSSSLIA